MITRRDILTALTLILTIWSCETSKSENNMQSEKITAKFLLGNPDYPAISYGGYRDTTRNIQPKVEELKEDMLILSALGIKVLRTYNVKLAHASNVLKAISELKRERPGFEMYVMLGAWIDCKNAWTDLAPDHEEESAENEEEIARAVDLANKYPDIVKVIAVGNEAMVKWATTYYVQPWVILKWVSHLQALKSDGKLSKDVWITSSDNFASWGGGDAEYHVEDLNKLIQTVDYVSMHTYPMHDTHYNPSFWGLLQSEDTLAKEKQVELIMQRALAYAKSQFESVKAYVNNVSPGKPIHIGETGWASSSNELYGPSGSRATDEYKEGVYHRMMRKWTNENNISCFYFQAFDEPWKDAHNPGGSENYFGLFTVDGKAKYTIWSEVDAGKFEGLTRAGNPITKTYDGDYESLLNSIVLPPIKTEMEVIN